VTGVEGCCGAVSEWEGRVERKGGEEGCAMQHLRSSSCVGPSEHPSTARPGEEQRRTCTRPADRAEVPSRLHSRGLSVKPTR